MDVIAQAELKAVGLKDVKFLCSLWFDIDLTEGEVEIVRSVAFQEHKRLIICTYTRYGKTFCCALGVAIYILLNENKVINHIAPIRAQTEKMREYLALLMFKCGKFQEIVPKSSNKLEQFKDEFNKSKIIFKNNIVLKFLSAEGKGDRLMGEGGNLVIVEEGCLINKDIYALRISRMLGDSPDSVLIEIGNPLHKFNQFWEHWNDPNFSKIHISYLQGISEGRISEKFIEEQKETMINIPNGFKVMYEALFPDDSDNTLIKYDWIKNALDSTLNIEKGEFVYGLDCAEFGNDLNVLVKLIKSESNHYQLLGLWFKGKMDTMQAVSWAVELIGKDFKSNIYVDSTGVGAGVYARLKELGYKSNRVMVGSNPTVKDLNAPDFMNFKAQAYWNLRNLFEQNKIRIQDIGNLKLELNSMQYVNSTAGKVKIIDPVKSPDFADALMLACSGSLQRDYFMVFA